MDKSLAAQLKATPSEMRVSELEDVALRLFEERGFDAVTVEEIAAEARILVRTVYCSFLAKEDVLQVAIDRRSDALRVALSGRPINEPPLRSLRLALAHVLPAEDLTLLRRWIAVIAGTTNVVKSVLGGLQLKTQRVIAEFLGARLGVPSDRIFPTMLAAAAGGVLHAALTRCFLHGGDVGAMVSEGLDALEHGIEGDSRTWSEDARGPGLVAR